MNDMHDDWLWDKRGAPDPELARIERALGAFRMQVTATPLLPRRPAQLARTLLAAAAIVSTAVGLALVHVAGAPAGPSPYSVESIAGRVAVQDPSGRARGDEARPGDVVSTGTPDGVGKARNPPRFLKPGDVIEARVQGLGEQRTRVVAEQS